MNSRQRSLVVLLPLVVAAVTTMFLVSSCASRLPRRDPTGETFPSIRGRSLAGDAVRIPDVATEAGEPLLLFVGYVQDAQFDIDRWLLGVTQAELDVKFFELPTIAGMVPRMFSGQIDDGMRGGIPVEDWGGVVTVYGDAPEVVALTGSERPRNGRVLLLDADGRIVWFHDRGYSASVLTNLQAALESLRKGS